MGALASTDLGSSSGDLAATEPRTLGEDPPGLLLDRDVVYPGLQAEPLGDLVVQVANDDRGHGGDIVL